MSDLMLALTSLGFAPDDSSEERIGWRGTFPAPSTAAHFRCEFCSEEHLDCTEIPHREDCPVLLCRAALSKAEPRP